MTLDLGASAWIDDGSCSSPLSGDSLLGPLTDNGGATQTHAPLAGSPLIDAGANAVVK